MLQLCYRVVRHTHDPAVFCENCQKIRKYFMQHGMTSLLLTNIFSLLTPFLLMCWYVYYNNIK